MYETYTVVESRSENYRTRTLVLDGPPLGAPGQFVMAWLPGVDERPFSIAGDDPLTLMVVAVGPFSRALHRLVPGDRIWIRGPLGKGFRLPEGLAGKRVLLVGGGYGVAPLHFLARRALAAGAAVEVAIGARTQADVLLAGAFDALGAAVRVATEDGSAGERGLVTAVVAQALAHRRPDVLYGCGPVPLLQALEGLCDTAGIPYQLSWEARMRCGLGLCGACEVHGHGREGWLACTDGPVYDGSGPRGHGESSEVHAISEYDD